MSPPARKESLILSGVPSPRVAFGRDGPGDSGRVVALSMIWERLSAGPDSLAPHISQLLRDG